jgi:ketosteroid isomerase-like protein
MQDTKLNDAARSDAVRSYFGAYESEDRDAAELLLADDFTFTSPNDDNIDRATYFERCWPQNDAAREQTIEKIVVEGDKPFVTYTCATGNGKSFRNTEFFTFAGERIASVDVYFGAAYQDGVIV